MVIAATKKSHTSHAVALKVTIDEIEARVRNARHVALGTASRNEYPYASTISCLNIERVYEPQQISSPTTAVDAKLDTGDIDGTYLLKPQQCC